MSNLTVNPEVHAQTVERLRSLQRQNKAIKAYCLQLEQQLQQVKDDRRAAADAEQRRAQKWQQASRALGW